MIPQLIFFLMIRRVRSQRGQDLAEYGLLVGFIAVIVLVAVTVFGTNLQEFWERLSTALPW